MRFRDQVGAADGMLFCTPEYNRGVPGVLKNAIDVGSRPYGKSVWDQKPAAIVSASPGSIGGFGANHQLRQACVFLNMPVMQQPEAYLGHVSDDSFDADGCLKEGPLKELVAKLADAFHDWVDAILRAAAAAARCGQGTGPGKGAGLSHLAARGSAAGPIRGCREFRPRASAARHDFLEAIVKRREAEADEVGRAEIADHAAGDQCLHDRIAIGVGEADLAAALRRIARAGERHFAPQRASTSSMNSATARATWPRSRHGRYRRTSPTPASSAASARIDGVPVRKRVMPAPGDSRRRRRTARHGPSSPAIGERNSSCKLLGDEQEGRRAGPAVQIFVAASDREVAAGAVEIELQRAGAVRQVPQRQRALGMRGLVDRAPCRGPPPLQ